jgi:Uma2 family endonuclease
LTRKRLCARNGVALGIFYFPGLAKNFSEYSMYQPPPGFRDELINGKVVLSLSLTPEHQDICKQIERLLERCIDRKKWVAQRDTTMYVREEEGPRPDVFAISRERWDLARGNKTYPQGVPEVAIEVRSPSNRGSKFQKKLGCVSVGPAMSSHLDCGSWNSFC